jgi:hypothetical protein
VKPPHKGHDAREVLRQFHKRFGDVKDLREESSSSLERSYRWQEDLFEEQLAFINDPASFKTALCSRRAGKTYASCYYLIETASKYPDSLSAYIGLTRSSAKRLMWTELKKANRKYHIGMTFNNSELICTFPNGSQIVLTGANDEADIDKLRGSAYRLVILDEAASFGAHMEELVEEVLEPALIDHNGVLAMIGTPNAACAGMFFKATTDPRFGYSNHGWTILDNPHIPHAQEWLDKRMNQKGWDANHPVYLREWKGQWIRSDDSLVYKYNPDRNFYTELPHHEHDFDYILGVDLGYEDATAFVIGAYSRDLPHFYVVDCYKQTKMLPSEIAERIQAYNEQYRFTSIVADTGGLGKSIVEEFRQRWALSIRAAEKRNKDSYIELMNSDLACGHIQVQKESPVVEEWKLLQWDEDRRKEDSRFENHLSDACLYAWRESKHYTFTPELAPPERGTPEFYEALEGRIWESREKELAIKDTQSWWDEGWTLN